MHTVPVVQVTDKKSIRSLFINSPLITLVGYWWFLPPSMGEASYTIFQENGQASIEARANTFAAGHGGHVTPSQVNGQGVTTFKVVLPLPTGDNAPETYVQLGQDLFAAMTILEENEE